MARVVARMEKVPKKLHTLVLGFPNRGNVGVLCASYLLEKLEMEQVGEAAFFCLKPALFRDEEGVGIRNTADVYTLGKAPGVAVFHCGDQPEGADAWEMGAQILDMARGWGVKRVVSAGAMPLSEEKVKKMAAGAEVEARRCEVAASSPGIRDAAMKAGAEPCKGGGDLVIVGLEGLIPGLAPRYGMDGALVLAETPYFDDSPELGAAEASHDLLAALSALKVLKAMLSLDLDLAEAESRAKEMGEVQSRSLRKERREQVSTGHG